MHFVTTSLAGLRHDVSGTPVIRILSRLPTRRLKNLGEQSDTGSIVALIFLFVSSLIVLFVEPFVMYVAAVRGYDTE